MANPVLKVVGELVAGSLKCNKFDNDNIILNRDWRERTLSLCVLLQRLVQWSTIGLSILVLFLLSWRRKRLRGIFSLRNIQCREELLFNQVCVCICASVHACVDLCMCVYVCGQISSTYTRVCINTSYRYESRVITYISLMNRRNFDFRQ